MTSNSQTRHGTGRREDGYVMMALLLAVALLIMFAAVIVPSITFDIKRDREEELIHRGTQYSRAIRAYYKKFGRYPTKIEDLESANNLRFLRKRYKDPVTGQDFKLLHFGEVKLTLSGGIGGGSIPGATPVSGMNGGPTGGPTGSGGFSQPSTFGGSGGFGGNASSSFGQNQQNGANTATGADASQPGAQASPNGSGTNSTGTASDDSNSSSGDKLSGVVFGGGPIVGVASSSKKDTIREFNHKKKYNDWQFIYDPAMDRGGLITTPNQPQMMGFGQSNGSLSPQNGQSGSGQNGTGFGNSFGTSPTGMQNNPNQPPNQPTSGGFGTTNQPSNPPQQQ